MTVRAKLRLIEVTELAYSPTARKLKFEAQYDESIPEDRRFSQATPTASLEMYVDNPGALEQLKLDGTYYVDFTPAESTEG